MTANPAIPVPMPTAPDKAPVAPILRDPDRMPERFARPVLALGNFDGVHGGHRIVIERARALALATARPIGVLTFKPHPTRFFRPDAPFFSLTPGDLRLDVLATLKPDFVCVLNFDATLAATPALTFIEEHLLLRLDASGLVAGHDFHFGKGREGSPTFLTEQAARLGYAIDIVAPVSQGDRVVSSTAIRQALTRGEIATANALLGYRWCVRATVAHGDKRGRDLGFPTANLHLERDCGLAHGIYAVRAAVNGRIHDGVASFGSRPTFDDGPRKLEVHLFDFAGDLYDAVMTVEFVSWIRAEAKFDGVAPLMTQMQADSLQARRDLMAAGSAPSILRQLAAPDMPESPNR